MPRPTESSIRRLSEVLRARAELADYIKSLHLTVRHQTCFDDDDLRSVLSRCSKVSTFELVSKGPRSPVLPDDTRTRTLEPILYSTFPTKIVVSGSILRPEAVTFFARCQDSPMHLVYAAEGYKHTEMPSAIVVGTKTKFLRHLNTQLTVAWCLLQSKGEDNQPIMDLSELRVLSLAALGETYRMQRLNTILHCAARLERLSLRLYLGDSGSISGLLKSPLPCLTTLRYIDLYLDFPWNSSDQSLPTFRGLFDELQRSAVHNVLEDVVIRLNMFDRRSWTVVTDDWLPLATFFNQQSFPCLKTVHVRALVVGEYAWAVHVANDISNLPYGDLELDFDFAFTLHYDYQLFYIEFKKSK